MDRSEGPGILLPRTLPSLSSQKTKWYYQLVADISYSLIITMILSCSNNTAQFSIHPKLNMQSLAKKSEKMEPHIFKGIVHYKKEKPLTQLKLGFPTVAILKQQKAMHTKTAPTVAKKVPSKSLVNSQPKVNVPTLTQSVLWSKMEPPSKKLRKNILIKSFAMAAASRNSNSTWKRNTLIMNVEEYGSTAPLGLVNRTQHVLTMKGRTSNHKTNGGMATRGRKRSSSMISTPPLSDTT
ncbi:MAG: hypothetical protein [Circular genetic element sp.]|nr:MAG: hypothetical protein [Circular genetic element sp.]